ncbi:MAG: flavin reductase family protein [Candidatus Micrarchaeia archaeon]
MEFHHLLYPRQVILVTSCSKGKKNIIALAWHSPLSFKPPLIGIAVGKTRFSHHLIKEGMEFVVSIPTESLREKVIAIGSRSGREIDKFSATGLTPSPAKFVKAPLIMECPINIECKLVDEFDAGDHTVFVGEVLEVHKSEIKEKLIFDRGGRNFFGVEKE